MATQSTSYPKKKAGVFAAVAVVWVVLDQLTKSLFAGQQTGGILFDTFAGLFDIRIVHNTEGT